MVELVPSGKQMSIYQHNFKGPGISRHSQNKVDFYFTQQPRPPHLKVLSQRGFLLQLPATEQMRTDFQKLNNAVQQHCKLLPDQPSSVKPWNLAAFPPVVFSITASLPLSITSKETHTTRLPHASVYLFQHQSGVFLASPPFQSPFVIFYAIIVCLVLLSFQQADELQSFQLSCYDDIPQHEVIYMHVQHIYDLITYIQNSDLIFIIALKSFPLLSPSCILTKIEI